MTWDYRVIKTSYEPSGEASYTINEVYYDDHGQIEGWSDAVEPHGESLEEPRDDMEHFKRALELPVLRVDEVEGNSVLVEADVGHTPPFSWIPRGDLGTIPLTFLGSPFFKKPFQTSGGLTWALLQGTNPGS